MTGHELVEIIRSYLAEKGLSPTIDETGDIAFKYEGFSYYISVEESEYFVRLVFPSFCEIEPGHFPRLAFAAFEVMRETRAIKIFSVGNQMYATTEMFVSHKNSFNLVFGRSIRALAGGCKKFVALLDA
jgi:hypothetical protein